MKQIYRNWSCKVFPGFYESFLYNSDTLYYLDRDELPEGFCWEFVKGGYAKFEEETCKDWVNAMDNNLYAADNPIGLKIVKFISETSPREYNFTTDKINIEIEVNLTKLKKWCWVTQKDNFNKYLYDHFTSYDGFISFIPNNLYTFICDYKNNRSKDNLIDVMIEYYLLQNIDFEDVLNDTLDSQWENLHNNITLQSEEDWSLWGYEYNDKTCKLVPTHKLEIA